jgi:hypothetical protein
MLAAMSTLPGIANLGEFIDTLRSLSLGNVMVRLSDSAGGCVLDGAVVYHSYETLRAWGLIYEFKNPRGFPHAQYYRLTDAGREFAERAWREWVTRPLWQRMALRLTH